MRRYLSSGLCAATIIAAVGHAQDAKKVLYPSMAPLEQYLMDRDAEVALAESAAPAAISRDATVWVLGRKGYETAREGKNGFVCMVERSWQAPFDDPEFWNPKTRGAICYNPPAAKSVVPPLVKRQQWVLAGLSKAQVIDSIKAAFAKGVLQAPAPGSMSYMMAKGARLNDAGNLAHVMFFEPFADASNWGTDKPFYLAQDPIDLQSVLIVPTAKWSDGSSASADAPDAPSPTS